MIGKFGRGIKWCKLRVLVVRDHIVEGTEKFNLMLKVPSSLGPAITVGSRDTAEGVIIDNTSMCVIM